MADLLARLAEAVQTASRSYPDPLMMSAASVLASAGVALAASLQREQGTGVAAPAPAATAASAEDEPAPIMAVAERAVEHEPAVGVARAEAAVPAGAALAEPTRRPQGKRQREFGELDRAERRVQKKRDRAAAHQEVVRLLHITI